MVSRNLLAAFMEEEAPQSSKRRAWDDEFVLKRQFSALIPAFDPRPGRTNINQASNANYLELELNLARMFALFRSVSANNRQRIWKFPLLAVKRRLTAA